MYIRLLQQNISSTNAWLPASLPRNDVSELAAALAAGSTRPMARVLGGSSYGRATVFVSADRKKMSALASAKSLLG